MSQPKKSTIKYKVVNGTSYNKKASQSVIDVIDSKLGSQDRITVYYGDSKTGKAWGDKESGRVGRSGGTSKIPLLISSSRSIGGGGILTGSIVKITQSKKPNRVLYKHPKYHEGT